MQPTSQKLFSDLHGHRGILAYLDLHTDDDDDGDDDKFDINMLLKSWGD